MYAFCRECITLYQDEVVSQGKDYVRFSHDFLRSHKHHDAADAHSKNEHEKNLGIMEDLLLGNRPIVEKYFSTGSTSHEQLALIFNELDRGERVAAPTPFVSKTSVPKQVRAVDFECHLTDAMLEKLTSCFNECGLFTMLMTAELTQKLFSCTLPSPLTCRNLRLLSVFFDGMKQRSLITPYWKSVIERNKLFLKNKGKGFVTAHDLSSALSQANEKKATSAERKVIFIVAEVSELAPKS